MANYDQNVTIDLNVDSSGFSEQLGAAVKEIRGAEAALSDVDSNLDESSDGFENFSKKIDGIGLAPLQKVRSLSRDINDSEIGLDIDTSSLLDARGRLDGLINKAENADEAKQAFTESNEAAESQADDSAESVLGEEESFKSLIDSADTLTGAKNAVTDSNAALDDQTQESKRSLLKEKLEVIDLGEEVDSLEGILDSLVGKQKEVASQTDDSRNEILGEEESFKSLIDSADTLTGAKNAVTNSNAALDDQTQESKRSLLEEKLQMMDLSDEVDSVQGVLDSLLGKQQEVGAQSRKTALGIDEETRSFEELMDGAQDLEGVKHAVANANQNVQNESGKSTRELLEESNAVDLTKQEMESLVKSQNSLSKSSMSASDKLRKMRNSIDDSTDSMRAASQVGELFSEGLGSLSINLGAFTIALRNFLTQIPLLITLLGSVGSAAIGAASALGALGGAMVALPLAGLFVKAQRLSEELAGVESASEALSVIFQQVQAVLIEAVEPLTNAVSEFSFFEDAIEALGFAVNVLSQNFAALTRETGMLSSILEGTGEELNTFQDLMGMIDGSTFEELASALAVAFAVLGDEAIAALSTLGSGLANSIVRSVNLLSTVGSLESELSQFSDTIAELSELGFKIAGGLLPVFTAFSSIIETVAARLNEMDGETMKNLVTFIAFIAAANKLSGVLSNVVTILPNVVVGLTQVSQQMNTAGANAGFVTKQFKMLQAGISGSATKLGVFLNQISLLSGVSALIASLGSSEERFREIAFSSNAAGEQFKKFAKESDDAAEELRELAIQGKLTQKNLQELSDSDADIDVAPDGRVDADQFLPDMGRIGEAFKQPGSAVQSFNDEMVSSVAATKRMNHTVGMTTQKVDGMSVAMSSVATQTAATTQATSLYSALTQTLSKSNLKATLSERGKIAALKSLFIRMGAAILQTMSYIAANLGLTSATLTTAGAVNLLNASISALTLGTFKIIGAIVGLIAVIGALTVGVLKNMDGIKSAFSSMFGTIKAGVAFTVDILESIFLAVWDAILQTLQPVISTFETISGVLSDFGSDSEESAGILGLLKTSIMAVVGAVNFLIRFLGIVGRVIMNVAVIPMKALIAVLMVGVKFFNLLGRGVNMAISAVLQYAGVIDSASESGEGLIETLTMIIDKLRELVSVGLKDFEESINESFIRPINDLIESFNQFTGFEVSKLEEVKLTGDGEAVDTSEAEPAKKEGNTVTYNEDSSTQINQEINADPEDKASLSRVVKDAINEANSFERQRQQGI